MAIVRPYDLKWIDVPPVADSFVVNTGRAMERISNQKLRATKHRVTFTKNVLRHSIPYARNKIFCYMHNAKTAENHYKIK